MSSAVGSWRIGVADELRQLDYAQRLQLQQRNVINRGEGLSIGRSIYETVLEGGAMAGTVPARRRLFPVAHKFHPKFSSIGNCLRLRPSDFQRRHFQPASLDCLKFATRGRAISFEDPFAVACRCRIV